MQQTLTVSRRERRRPLPRQRIDFGWATLPLVVIGVVLIWQIIVDVGGYRAFILPGPLLVGQRLVEVAVSGLLWQHTSVTLIEALGGFALALAAGTLLGYLLAHIPWLERVLAPILAASQAIPIVAVAPLIILWSGPGLRSKILVAALITFLPIVINTIIALRGIPRELREMALISGANRWQMLRYVELPLSLPVFFGGVRTGLALATTGAVVGEFVSGRNGLGAMINIARGLFDTPLIFVALVMLAAITLVFYLGASLLERMLVRWEQ